jgi:RHS repeat-associated protein
MENGSASTRYSTEYTYDRMGNFLTLKRNGKQDGGTFGLIDNLTFAYTGNQVTKIEDSVTDPTYSGVYNFMDGASQSNEYTYDKNGNLTKDLNKKISLIQYNLLNLPTSITYSTNNRSATYVYDATGKKLRVTYINPNSTTDYCGNMIYEGSTLKQVLIDGGYVTFSGSTPVYHYYLKDHLGNNRVVCSASGTVEQINHYYPFGGLFGESTSGDTQRFKYNGKELDRMHGLDWYDYGARHMDGMRFTTIDPLAEKYYNISPYAYCANNPLIYLDKDGKKIVMSQNNSQDFNNQYIKAINYLKEHGCSNTIDYLEKSEATIYVIENGPKSQNYTHRLPDKNEIGWNAKEGLLTDNGNKLSPAIRLLHELAHQEHKLRNPEKFLEDTKPNNSEYQSADEESIIKNEETQAAILCKEIPDNSISRTDHGGIPFDTTSSTSREILNPSDNVKLWQAVWEDNDAQ